MQETARYLGWVENLHGKGESADRRLKRIYSINASIRWVTKWVHPLANRANPILISLGISR